MKSKPSVVCLTETWADKGFPTTRIEGYKLVSRADGWQGGGVAVFALESLAHKVTHLEDSTVAERSWVIVHSDHGPYVIGCWHRPHAPGEIDSIRSLKEEVAEVLQREQLGGRSTVLHLQRDRTDTAHPGTHPERTSARPCAFQCP